MVPIAGTERFEKFLSFPRHSLCQYEIPGGFGEFGEGPDEGVEAVGGAGGVERRV